MSEWNWEPDDFAALWLNEARDRFPRPLHFTSRFRYREGFDEHCRAVRGRYTADETAAIDRALRTLETSVLRVEVFAETGAARSHNHTQHRIIGVRDLYYAVIAAQTVIDGVDGPIWVRQGRPENLGKGIASRVPDCAPGRQRPEELHPRELEYERDNYFVDVARNTPRERYLRLIDRPMTGSGSASIRAGNLHSRSDPTHFIEWLDYADDGRYLQRRTVDSIHITPGDNTALASQLTRWIDAHLRAMRDQQETNW
ncbi:ESX secretion-associated protein EspG [Nocardia sp. NPDC057663]|uniref:ESX secretion-associated protein EspG n=1 Tax=Nocardia sp. NPDC057663 TaxID=3346201 RepID=UPI00367050E0